MDLIVSLRPNTVRSLSLYSHYITLTKCIVLVFKLSYDLFTAQTC